MNTAHISRANIKQYWNFQRVTGKQYYKLFQSLYQTIQYWHFQRVPSKLNFSNKIFFQSSCHLTVTIFRELLLNNIDLFRAPMKKYSHFHRVITKQ